MDMNYTLIAVILDRSGSMATSQQATESGFDEFINRQKQVAGRCNVTLVQFDDEYEVVYENKPIADVPPLVLAPRGMTALLDAQGKTINNIGAYLSSVDESARPGRVIVMTMTDGGENASQEFSAEVVKAMVEEQRDKYNWDFMYLGANQDAIKTGAMMGIQSHKAMNYNASSARGVRNTFAAASTYTVSSRAHGQMMSKFDDSDRIAAMVPDDDAQLDPLQQLKDAAKLPPDPPKRRGIFGRNRP